MERTGPVDIDLVYVHVMYISWLGAKTWSKIRAFVAMGNSRVSPEWGNQGIILWKPRTLGTPVQVHSQPQAS